MIQPAPVPTWFRLISAGYLITVSAAMAVAVLWMVSPGFRYWLWRQGRELQYRWAVWEYQMRSEPVPEWVTRMTQETELPRED